MARKTIMHIIHSLPADGAEQLLIDILENINRQKFRFMVACIVEGGPLVKEIERLGISVSILNKRFKLDSLVLPKLISLMKREQVDLVHTHMFTAHSWGRTAAVLARVPAIVSTLHNTAYSKKRYMIWIDKFLAPFTDKIIAVSKEAFDSAYERAKISIRKMVTVTNGIDLSRFEVSVDVERKKAELGLRKHTSVVGIIARLFPQKGHRYFLQAAEMVLAEIPDVQFLIVGDGILRPELEDIVHNSKLRDHIRFTGVRRDIPEIMATLDVFVLSSLWEGLPIVLLEAMAAKKAIVATSVGGIPEVIRDRGNGLLVPPSNPEALKDGIVWALKHRREAAEMGHRAYNLVREKYSVKTTARKYEEIYEQSLRRNFETSQTGS